MNLLCPACHTPLPAAGTAVVACPACAAEIDVSRAGTVVGRPRFVPEIDRTGTTIGGYRIEARLGGGGMGTVYRAVGPDGRGAALKLLSPMLAERPDVVARFAREVTTLARLEHPAIVRVLGHGTEQGIPWFAMELVDGKDLRARIAAGPPLPPAETAALCGRLFPALAHAHARGVVHRDLKPANVLLAADGARLADFGIAHWEAGTLDGATAMTRLTETAAVIGTLPYMSPEQRRGGEVDRRSDLFSAGVMLYEASTGMLPQGAFAPPSEVNAAYGRAFDQAVLHLMQPAPERRPASAEASGAALAAALRPRRRGRLAMTVSAGAALVVVLVGGAFGGRGLLREMAAGKRAPNEVTAPKVRLPPPPNPSLPTASRLAPLDEKAAGAGGEGLDLQGKAGGGEPGAIPLSDGEQKLLKQTFGKLGLRDKIGKLGKKGVGTSARPMAKAKVANVAEAPEPEAVKAPFAGDGEGTIGMGNLGTVGKSGGPPRKAAGAAKAKPEPFVPEAMSKDDGDAYGDTNLDDALARGVKAFDDGRRKQTAPTTTRAKPKAKKKRPGFVPEMK